MKLDILAFGAHPDDVELASSGTLLHHIAKGKKVGIVDLTKGELGTRGTAETRKKEAAISAELMRIDARTNLDLGDGFFEINQENLIKIIEQIRHHQPDIVICNALDDRHPDHGRGGTLVARAAFLSGLLKIKTNYNGEDQLKWRPKNVFHYIQDNWIDPDFVIDITPYYNQKVEAILSFKTQFHNPDSITQEPETPISSPEFMKHIEGRAIAFGRLIQTTYGEGFTAARPIGIDDLTELL